jgi:hypothetical protein
MPRSLHISLLLSAALAGAAIAQSIEQPVLREFAARWVWATPHADALAAMRLPEWQRIDPERVAIDLSLDDGAAWTEVARGVPSAPGTNEYMLTIPDWPATLTDYARIRVRCIRTVANPAPDHIGARFTIAGIHFVSMPSVVTNGVESTLRWVAAGAGEFLQIGSRSPTASEWRADGLFASQDSIAGATTNTVAWIPTALPVPTAHIVLQSMSDESCYRIATLEVRNP